MTTGPKIDGEDEELFKKESGMPHVPTEAEHITDPKILLKEMEANTDAGDCVMPLSEALFKRMKDMFKEDLEPRFFNSQRHQDTVLRVNI